VTASSEQHESIRAMIDHADGAVAVLMKPIRTPGRLAHEGRDGGRNPCRGEIEESGLPKIKAGAHNAAGDTLRLGVGPALDGARLPRWLWQCWLPIPLSRGASHIFVKGDKQNGYAAVDQYQIY
jgi:hypothetical protein